MKPIYGTTLEMDVTRPVGEVFDHVARGLFENHGRWDAAIVGMLKTSGGPIGQGTTGIESRRYGAWSSSAPLVVDTSRRDSGSGPVLRLVIARNVRTNTERMRQSIERDGSAGRP
jgi:hypothetical protein